MVPRVSFAFVVDAAAAIFGAFAVVVVVVVVVAFHSFVAVVFAWVFAAVYHDDPCHTVYYFPKSHPRIAW